MRISIYVIILAPTILVAWGYYSGREPSQETLNRVQVISDIGKWEYWLQTPREGVFFARFCSDQAEPEFSAGQTLLYLRYTLASNCWARAHYKIERDEHGNPIRSN